MKIAIAATGKDLDATIESRLGLAKYLLIVDTDTGGYDALEIPFGPGEPGIGINLTILALEKGAEAIVSGHVSPRISNEILKAGIRIITCEGCSIREFLTAYGRGEMTGLSRNNSSPSPYRTVKQTALQFLNIMPIMGSVVLIIGLVRSFLEDSVLLALFRGHPLHDTLIGASAGSIFTGTPMNSYLIGDTLQKMEVSPFAITALLMTWVSVGLAQLPVEIAVLGRTFGLTRIITSFIISVIMAIIMVTLMGIIR